MNFDQPITVKEVFDWRPRELSAEEWSRIEASVGVGRLVDKLAVHAVTGGWESTRRLVLERVDSLLEISLPEILARAWSKSRELQSYRDSEKYPPDKEFAAILLEHEIVSTHKPRVEVLLDDIKIGEVNFLINLALELAGFKLIIRDARIRRIEAGSCQAQASLACEGCQLLEKHSRKLDLTLGLDLGEGFEI